MDTVKLRIIFHQNRIYIRIEFNILLYLLFQITTEIYFIINFTLQPNLAKHRALRSGVRSRTFRFPDDRFGDLS